MASTYSPSLRLELMATGDQSGTWGDTTNTNLGTLLEQAITGYAAIAQGDVANKTLTSLNGAADEARNMVVNMTGALTAARNVVVPTAEKIYLAVNSTSGGFALTFKTSAGTGVAVPAGQSRWVYCDGTNVVDGLGVLSLTFGGTGATTAIGAADALSTKSTNIASATTTDLSTATGVFVHITGTTTITGFGTAVAGVERQVVFDGALTITHNGTSLILPGGVNIRTIAGNTATLISEGSGNWRMTQFTTAPVSFNVGKGGVDQTGIGNGKITWSTAIWDIGGYFDTVNSRYTPPAGKYRLSSRVLVSGTMTDQAAYIISVYKNGSQWALSQVRASGPSGFSLCITETIDSNGTDFWEIFVLSGGASVTAIGTYVATSFCGEAL